MSKIQAASDPQPLVLATTDQWIVMSNPAGMLTIPGRNGMHQTGARLSLIEWVKENFEEAWVVHRLDFETSGVVLFARTVDDHRLANSWFQDRLTKKIYNCLANGVPSSPVFKINQPINGAASITQIEVRESFKEGFFARVQPRTGRRHQIRIHLAENGYAIWGDTLYRGAPEITLGVEKKILEIPRVALHASLLELPTKERFEAPLPDDFASWLGRLRKEGQSV
jgi:tRNA pseudouridine32 synthase/23S rRNA pseudouridine746 synthase